MQIIIGTSSRTAGTVGIFFYHFIAEREQVVVRRDDKYVKAERGQDQQLALKHFGLVLWVILAMASAGHREGCQRRT